MKKFIYISMLFFISLTYSQTYKRNSSGQLVSTTKESSIAARMSGDNITIKGVSYPVFVTAKGKYFINKISKKTGKEYKQYIKIE